MKFWILFFVIAFVAFPVFVQPLMTSPSQGVTALRDAGFTHIVLKEKHQTLPEFYGCGRDDVGEFTFRATNPLGVPATVKVCVGWPFKGATIRY